MRKISIVVMGLFLVLGMGQALASTPNNQVFSTKNADGKINAKSIEKSFNESSMLVDVNNDMNSIFSKRYKKVHHKEYNLAIFRNNESVTKLIKKYPSIGLITPLSMSIYQDAEGNINVSTLSLKGMARITQIPETDADLIAYAKQLDVALHKALPKGAYLKRGKSTADSVKALTSDFTAEIELEDDMTFVDAKESFEEEFESEIGPLGFLVPKKYNLQEELMKSGNTEYDFYDTYSIIRFNVIFPVSKEHPDAGSYAPFTLAMYKKKDEEKMHIRFPSIENWIDDLGITDEESLKEVKKTHSMVIEILEELTE